MKYKYQEDVSKSLTTKNYEIKKNYEGKEYIQVNLLDGSHLVYPYSKETIAKLDKDLEKQANIYVTNAEVKKMSAATKFQQGLFWATVAPYTYLALSTIIPRDYNIITGLIALPILVGGIAISYINNRKFHDLEKNETFVLNKNAIGKEYAEIKKTEIKLTGEPLLEEPEINFNNIDNYSTKDLVKRLNKVKVYNKYKKS